jgi:hypothetical protein
MSRAILKHQPLRRCCPQSANRDRHGDAFPIVPDPNGFEILNALPTPNARQNIGLLPCAVLEHRGVQHHIGDGARGDADGHRLMVHKVPGEDFLVARWRFLWFREIAGELTASPMGAGNSGYLSVAWLTSVTWPTRLMVTSGFSRQVHYPHECAGGRVITIAQTALLPKVELVMSPASGSPAPIMRPAAPTGRAQLAACPVMGALFPG